MKTTIRLDGNLKNVLKEMAIRAALEEVVYQNGLDLEDFIDRNDFYELLGVSNWYLSKLKVAEYEINKKDFLIHLFSEDATFWNDTYFNEYPQ